MFWYVLKPDSDDIEIWGFLHSVAGIWILDTVIVVVEVDGDTVLAGKVTTIWADSNRAEFPCIGDWALDLVHKKESRMK